MKATRAAAVAVLGLLGVARGAQGADDIFRTRVAPLLAARCGGCHGPDTAESGFRIDLRERAIAGGDSGAVGIVAGRPAESELIARVESSDPESRMPADAPPLSAEERTLLREWITLGAAWPDDWRNLPAALLPATTQPAKGAGHWAFQPLTRPAVPAPPAGDPWPATGPLAPIDAFLARRLADAGLAFNPEADPRTLIRRVMFDLVGLPPTPEEIAAFAEACRAAGGIERPYGDLVDRLLASPRHGERWARHWLDVVRFAESHGFEMNRARDHAWPYRDWVIAAFNADMPYDEFVRRQLCGDQCGDDAATGFLVAGPHDMVTSPDPVLTATQRADELHDMVSTTGSAFLGLSLGCARCHDHKFDPIPQADYYAVKAVFAGVEHGDRPLRPPDDEDRQRRIAALRHELAEPERRLAAFQPVASLRRSIVVDDESDGAQSLKPPSGTAAHADGTDRGHIGQPGGLLDLPDIGRQYTWWAAAAHEPVMAYAPRAAGLWRVWVSWGAGHASHAHDARYVLDADGDPATVDDREELATVDQRFFADGTGGPPPGKSLWSGFRALGVRQFGPEARLVLTGGAAAGPVTADVVVFEEVPTADTPGGTFPELRSRVTHGANVDRFPPVTARALRFTIRATSGGEPCIDELTVFSTDGREVSREATPSASGTYAGDPAHALEHVNDGRLGNARSWISDEVGGGWVQLAFAAPVEIDRVVWSRDRSDEPRFHDRVATGYEIAVSADGDSWQVVASECDRLPFGSAVVGPILASSRWSEAEAAEADALATRVASLRERLAAIEVLPLAYAGRFATPDRTHRLFRGDPMQPREEIPPGGLSHLGGPWHLPPEAPEPERRRRLAEWITAPGHPLTARVIVNRLWHHHFGTGLVDTPSDLGVNGGVPTHPELIDWLASELVDPAGPADRWRLRRIHRLMVMSRAYRQSAAARPDGLERDAAARLLWRHPPRRLEAEPLRDAILAVSGSLDTRMGGPGFDLFEPNTNYVKVYTTKTTFTPDDFRRMVYQAKPRAELDAFFGAFDCPDAGQVQPARTVSTTPLQALNMLNGAFLLDQAERFARRVELEVGDDPSRQVRRAVILAFGREATAGEVAAGRELVAAHGLALLCRSLYNATEFIMVY